MDHLFKAPLYIVKRCNKNKSGIKKVFFNLNKYRNWHFQASNDYKKEYSLLMFPQIRGLIFKNIKRIEYRLYAHQKNLDLSNVCSIHDKFFCDALIEYGAILDDNVDHIKEVTYKFMGVDKDDPRVEICIFLANEERAELPH